MDMDKERTTRALFLRVVSEGAEFLVQGHLMRRNILTYKAPPNNRGYDLICVHPDPAKLDRAIKIQVKSRYQTDCDRSLDVNEKTLDAFDFLVAVFLNIGNYFQKRTGPAIEGRNPVQFYTFPVAFVKEHCDRRSSRQKLRTRNLDIERYEGDHGFEQVANILGVDYPDKLFLANDQRPSTNDRFYDSNS